MNHSPDRITPSAEPKRGGRAFSGAAWWLLAAVAVLMLFLNFHTGMAADDFTFSISRAIWQRVTRFDEIVPNLAYMRRHSNGRVFPHFFAMLFLLLPKGLFNLVNTAASTLLVCVLLRYVRTEERRRDLGQLVFLLGALWLLMPAFGQVFLWLTGSCNYSWTMLLSLIYLLPFFRAWQGRTCFPSGSGGTLLRAAFLPLAFVTGGWSENGGMAVLFAAFCFLVLTARRERRLDGFLSAALLVGGCGFLFLMLSPSELGGRRGKVSESTLTRALEALTGRVSPALLTALGLGLLLAVLVLAVLFLKRRRLACRLAAGLLMLGVLGLAALFVWSDLRAPSAAAALGALLSDTKLLLLLAFGLWGLLLLLAYDRGVPGETLISALILGLAALGSVAIFFFALYFPARSSCPAIIYTTLADALLLSALYERGCRAPQRVLSALMALLLVLVLPFALRDVLRTDALLTERRLALEAQAVERPGSLAVVKPVTPWSKYPACWPGDEDHFEEDMGWYYGLSAVVVTEYVNR